MQKQAAKKQGLEGIGALEIGTIVHLRLADVDRAKLDNPNATLVVLDVTAKQNYTVGNQAGIYKEKVSRVHLTPLSHATPPQLRALRSSWLTTKTSRVAPAFRHLALER